MLKHISNVMVPLSPRNSQGVAAGLGCLHPVLPGQTRLGLELALELAHGITQAAGAEDFVLSSVANAAPSRPSLTMVSRSDQQLQAVKLVGVLASITLAVEWGKL